MPRPAKAPKGAFAISGGTVFIAVVRTRVYVDGFNLYYGALKNTEYKWLDIKALCEQLLPKENQIVGIKYFTARVYPSHSDPTKHARQNLYLTALKKFTPDLEIYYGKFNRHLVSVPMAASDLSKLPQGTIVRKGYRQSLLNTQWVSRQSYVGAHVDIVKTEEKGSDVNLALHLLNDAWQDKYDTAIIISNDSDLAGAIDLAKVHGKTIGIMTATGRPTRQLETKAHFHKRISARYLKKAQLPRTIPGTNITKPTEWTKASRTLSVSK